MGFVYRSLRRHGQSSEKVNRGMILAPLVGIIVNLLDASLEGECKGQNDVIGVFASMDCPDTVHYGFQYLLDYNWVSVASLLFSSVNDYMFVCIYVLHLFMCMCV